MRQGEDIETVCPPKGYGIGFFFGGDTKDTIVGCWGTEAEAREALSKATVCVLGAPDWYTSRNTGGCDLPARGMHGGRNRCWACKDM